MFYNAKLEIEEFNKMIDNKNGHSIKFRIASWIEHLSNKRIFSMFFKEHKSKIFKKTDLSNHKVYSIEVNKEDWELFQENCDNYRFSANYALNILVIEYNKSKEGFLFEIKIKV